MIPPGNNFTIESIRTPDVIMRSAVLAVEHDSARAVDLERALQVPSRRPWRWERLNNRECRYQLRVQKEVIGELNSERSPLGSAITEVRLNNKMFIIRPDLDGPFPSQTTISIETDDRLVGTYKPLWKNFPWKGGQLHLVNDAIIEWSQRDLVCKFGIFRSPSGPIILTYEALFQNLIASLRPWQEPGQLTISTGGDSWDLSLILAVGWHLMVHT